MDTDGPLYQHYAVGDVKHFAAFARICPVFVCPRAFIINAPQALVLLFRKLLVGGGAHVHAHVWRDVLGQSREAF